MRSMVRIPAGTAVLGSAEDDDGLIFLNETPRHVVYLDAYEIDATPVTNADWARYCRETGARLPKYWGRKDFDGPDQPVVGVTWEEACAYARWAGKRLPTEAEWERAARGTLVGARYPWGDEDPTPDHANFDRIRTHTTPVRRFPPNTIGLYDMAGNVWEWCADWYQSDAYAVFRPYDPSIPESEQLTEAAVNPTGPATGSRRVVRGGSWGNFAGMIRCAYRGFLAPDARELFVGFRCVRDVRRSGSSAS